MTKYPKKKKGRIKAPYLGENGRWFYGFLNTDGTIDITCLGFYVKKNHAWIPCKAYNKRKGYTNKQVKKIVKQFYNVKKEKKIKKK